jgi:hypothetical protein
MTTRKKRRQRKWQRELAAHPKIVEQKRRLIARKRELDTDEQFIIEEARLQGEFEKFFAKYPKPLKEFFRQFSSFYGFRLGQIKQFLDSLSDERLRRLLNRYIAFVSRFGVQFKFHERQPRFRRDVLIPYGSKFHVRMVKRHFEPGQGSIDQDAQFGDSFESERINIPPAVQEQITSGKVKFVEFEDESWSSALNELEHFAYYPEGLTFVLHQAEQPYLLCLIGEKVSDKLWRQASPVKTALLKKSLGRGTAGRRRDPKRLRESIKIRQRGGPLKGKITQNDKLKKPIESGQAYLSRVGKLLRP